MIYKHILKFVSNVFFFHKADDNVSLTKFTENSVFLATHSKSLVAARLCHHRLMGK